MTHQKTLRRVVMSAALAALLASSVVACAGNSGAGGSPAPSPTTTTSNGPMDAATTAKLDAIIDNALTTTGIPGAIVGIWSPSGDYTSAAGVADTTTGAPMTTELATRIGSATKPFTVTVVLQLVDEGKVELDDPISKYVEGVTDGDEITVRQLAGMRSGLPEYSATEAFVADYLADTGTSFTPQRLLGYVADQPVGFAPGTQFEYSNTNTILLGLLVERVTGGSLAEAITDRILKPLKLEHTLFPIGSEMPDPHARGYTNQTADGSVADATDYNPSWGWAAGAMSSNLQDLGRWVPALVNGDLLSAETQRERLRTEPIEEGDDSVGYGLGLFNINGWIGHNGSLPGYKTVTVYLPEQETTLVVLINTDIDGETDLVDALMAPITELISPAHIYGN
ncbi:serine hydrolase [Agromyces sp. Root81]|uniref:serine hydrolase domain-containing protein n=1 Tax=Agromyces sp. Root81 TaxID=1736601 RepID=UPI0006FCF286|nr:serine hydrolase domain-containing protein [Agromyces sp. Root81]KRC62440.1 serine hydrolase [Agromyces sp. Root81]